MSRTFKIGLFALILLFFYNTTWCPFAKVLTEKVRWVLLGTMCLWALSSPKSQPGQPPGTGLKFFTFAFAFLAVLSCTWSWVRPLYTLGRGLSVLALAIFLRMALWPRLKSSRDYLGVLNVLVASAWVMTLANVAVWAAGLREASRWPTGAVQGVFGNPNGLGMVYASLLPVLVAKLHYKKSLSNLALLVASVTLLVASQSRAGWLGGALGTCAFYAGYYGKKLWLVVLAVFIAAGVGIFIRDVAAARSSHESPMKAIEAAMLRGESDVGEYGSGRIPLWIFAFDKWKLRPLLGYGFGTAGDTYYAGGDVPARFHSSFVQIAVELGIVGLFFFVAPIVFSAFRAARSRASSLADPKSPIVIAGLAGGWFGGVMDSFFESWLFAVGNVAAIIAWLCFFAAMKGMSSHGEPRREGK